MKRVSVVSIVSAVSVFICLVFCGFRFGFVFVDNEVFNGFCYLIWAIFIANSLLQLGILRSRLTDGKHFSRALFGVSIGITVLSVVCTAAFLIIGGSEEFINYVYSSLEVLPYLSVFYALIFFVFVFPFCAKTFRAAVSVVTAAAIVLTCTVFLFPLGGFSFRCSPAVFDDGNSYKVVFATNRKSLGYVQYEHNGETVVLWDCFTGRKESQTVHSVDVPYEHLEGNGYTVGAVRVFEDIAYGGHTGKTITQSVDSFTERKQDDINLLCISDNHACRIDWTLLKSDCDIAVFLGDYANAVYSQENMINDLLIPAATVTGGQKPVIYVRGNHCHRGAYAKDAMDNLGYDTFYYRVNAGKYVFTVLDTGEDKTDDNFEYSGFNDYDSYAARQTQWIQSLQKTAGYQLTLAHCAELFESSREYVPIAADSLKALGTQLIIGGHYHTAQYYAVEDRMIGIPFYTCGARSSINDLTYTVINLNNGEASMVSYNVAGDIVNQASQTLISN